MLSIDSFSKLLHVLYSAPLEERQWQNFLALLSRHTQSKLSVFICADSRLGVMCRAQGGSTEADQVDVLAYNQRYVQSDPFRGPCLRDPRPRIVQDEDLLPNQGLLRTDLYRDLLAPRDCRFATLLLLAVTVRRIEIITIWRSPEQGPMDADCLHLLELLFPHLQKALDIRQVLGVTQQNLAGATAMADASPTASFLVRRGGRVIQSNAAGRRLIAGKDCLALQDGNLTPANGDARKALQAVLSKAAECEFSETTPAATQALALPRAHGSSPLQLLAIRLPLELASETRADVLVLVTDPQDPPNFPDSILRSLYGLTKAEAEVANGLLMGFSLDEIASLRRVTPGTTRNQLKAILAKTHSDRQSDLIRLLMTLPHPPAAN